MHHRHGGGRPCAARRQSGYRQGQLARGLANSIDMSFKRIQFTPDLPSDVVGVTYYDQKLSENSNT